MHETTASDMYQSKCTSRMSTSLHPPAKHMSHALHVLSCTNAGCKQSVASQGLTFLGARGLRAVGRWLMPARQASAYTPLLVRTKASSDDRAWRVQEERNQNSAVWMPEGC